jgi:hypothetical protein
MIGGSSTQDGVIVWADRVDRAWRAWRAGWRAAAVRRGSTGRGRGWNLAFVWSALLLASALPGCGEWGGGEGGRASGLGGERESGQTSPGDRLGASAGGSEALGSLQAFGSRASEDLRRVVSWSPPASRFVRAIGAESLLVGLDPESARILGRRDLERAAHPDALIPLAPDLLLIGEAAGRAIEESIEAAGISVVVFEPHDLDDLMTLVRDVGERLVGRAAAARFERELSRPLAEIGGASFGAVRPRVAPLVGIDPLELAGGHSFETDLIEIAGGSSITHGGEETRVRLDRAPSQGLPGAAGAAPELFVYFAPRQPSAEERARLRARLPAGVPLGFFPVEHDRFWLEAPAEGVRRLRRLILDEVGGGAGTSQPSGAATMPSGPHGGAR